MGKYVLITGAYGGMGYACAKLLAKKGFTVFALDILVREAEANIIPIKADLTDQESVLNAFKTVSNITEELYAIIHFAGVYRLDSLVEMSEERFKGIFDINVFGAYRVNKTFLSLLKSGSRVIITTSELAPLQPLAFTGIYAVSKCALEKYAFSLRMELQFLGVKVAVIRPGAVDTGLLSVSTKELDNFTKNTKIYTYNADKFKKIVDKTESKSVAPQTIAKTAFKALSVKNPKYVYNVNRNIFLRLLNLLPAKLQTKIIGNILKQK